MTVRIAKPVDTIGFTALDVALDKGYFKEQGVTVKTVLLGGSSVSFSALQSGSVQFSTGASFPLLQARSKRIPLVSIAGINAGVPLKVIVGGDRMKKVQPSQPFEQRMKVLAGAKIGYISATDGGFIDLLLKKANLPTNTVKKVKFDSASGLFTALRQGAIDAGINSPPGALDPVVEGKAAVVADVAEIPEYAKMTYDIVITSEKYQKANPKAVSAVATAIAKATNLMRANPAEVLQIEQQHYPKYSKEVLQQSLSGEKFAANGLQDATYWNNAVSVYKAAGQLPASSNAVEGEVWTNKYIKLAALKGHA